MTDPSENEDDFDFPSLSIKDFPGPFFPLDEALQFDDEEIENSSTPEEQAKVLETLKRNEEIQKTLAEEVNQIRTLKRNVNFDSKGFYGIHLSAFRDMETQRVNYEAMTGQIVPLPWRRQPGKFNLMELTEKPDKSSPSYKPRLYRKQIRDPALMAWHRYNVEASQKYTPAKELPPLSFEYHLKGNQAADRIWKMNKTSPLPSLDDLFRDEEAEALKRTKPPGSVAKCNGPQGSGGINSAADNIGKMIKPAGVSIDGASKPLNGTGETDRAFSNHQIWGNGQENSGSPAWRSSEDDETDATKPTRSIRRKLRPPPRRSLKPTVGRIWETGREKPPGTSNKDENVISKPSAQGETEPQTRVITKPAVAVGFYFSHPKVPFSGEIV